MSRWYTLKEASGLTSSVVGMPPKYWERFFSNTSRGVRSQKACVDSWMRVATKIEDRRIMIEEESLQTFLNEATHRSFPLRHRPGPYTKEKTVMKSNITGANKSLADQLSEAWSVKPPELPAQKDETNNATTPLASACVGLVDGNPSIIVTVGGHQQHMSVREATTLAESLRFTVEATALWASRNTVKQI